MRRDQSIRLATARRAGFGVNSYEPAALRAVAKRKRECTLYLFVSVYLRTQYLLRKQPSTSFWSVMATPKQTSLPPMESM